MVDGVPTFHPEPETLLAYAAGGLDEATSVLVATHLALCPACRREVARLEALGGAMTETIEPVALSTDALAATLARLDDPAEPPRAEVHRAYDRETIRAVPAPLRDYLGSNLSAVPWRWRGPAIREYPLSIGADAGASRGPRASLIRVGPGAALPAHTHTGAEYTLVLCGAFVDDGTRFGRGDVSTATSADDHKPVATPDAECICFAVIDGALRLTGPLGRLLNPLLAL